MALMKPRWDESNKRWECSLGSGTNRVWFRCKIPGEQGKLVCLEKRERHLHGPAPLMPGSLAEFIESVWWPNVKVKCTPSTIRGYRYVVEKHISRFYAMQINDMRLEVMQGWVSGLAAEASPKRVHNIFSILAGILELARLTDRYHRLDHRLVALPEIEQTSRMNLTIEKVGKLLAAARGTEMEGPVWTASNLGLRRNEVCGLKRPHVEIHGDTATIAIQDNRQPQGESNKLKSKRRGKKRQLDVPRQMAEKLLSFADSNSLYIFSYNEKPIHPDRLTKRMAGLCATAGVEHMQFKELRSACRSNLKAAGVPEVDIMRILGHSSYKTSLLYQDERPAAIVEAFQKLLNL